MSTDNDHFRYTRIGDQMRADLNPGHAGSVLNCPHPACVAARESVDNKAPATDEVMDDRIKALLYEIGNKIKSDLPGNWGFTLFLFSYEQGGPLLYLSSADRASMISSMKEFLARETGAVTAFFPDAPPQKM